MNPSSEDVKDMLVAASLGLTFATNLFIGREPTKPNNCVTIFDTPGFPPQLTLDAAGRDYYYPSVQIRVRNTSYADGWALANNIMVSLHGRVYETSGGTLYTTVYCSSGPALLDWDENNRARFIVNFNLQRHE